MLFAINSDHGGGIAGLSYPGAVALKSGGNDW